METRRKSFSLVVNNILFFAGIFVFLTSAIGPDENKLFGDWDADNDNKISETEFSEGLFAEGKNDAGLFDGDDKDSKGLSEIGEDDFYESSYDWWDSNSDEQLDENEWEAGYDNSYGDYLEDDFEAYDANSDGYLDYDEYYDSVSETEYFSQWDANDDDLLDNDEYSTGVFDTWDLNDDSYIDENEFDDFNI